jgi:hypothetical protein
MSSPTTVIDAAARPAQLAGEGPLAGEVGEAALAGEASGYAAEAAKVRHSRSCPSRQTGGACEPWCRAFPCPAWCTGAHRAGNPVYHLAARCPPGCSGHPNADTEADLAHADPAHREYLEVCVWPAGECPAEGCRADHRDCKILHVLVGDSDAARSAQA